jgi:predicted AAA+ superfamily ATPase
MPVVVLEGGRAVGKTTMCRRLAAEGAVGSLVELDDRSVLAAVSSDPEGYLGALQTPVVVDEAQLLPAITLAVKRLVDRTSGNGHFVLTGSTRLDRGQLGGSDPMAGRSTNLVLRPMTAAEALGGPLQTLDRLTDASLAPRGGLPATPRPELIRRLRRGGLPRWALSAASWRAADVGQYIESVLHEDADGSRVDRSALTRLLRALAGRTAGIVNVSSLANDLAIARGTINDYIARLERAHLIERVYGLRGSAAGENRTNPKIHATDSSLAFWASSRTTQEPSPEVVGAALETYILNEIMAQASWSVNWDDHVTYWRDNRTKLEVDLVVADAQGRHYGFEVKSAARVSSQDTRGLDQLRRQRGMARGFVLYTGTELYEIGLDIWALPISYLWTPWDGEVTTTDISTPIGRAAIEVSPGRPSTGPALFVSSVHRDNETEGGAILAFAKDLADRFEFLTGEGLAVFADTDIGWGEPWKQRLDTGMEQATFFLAIVTPRFLRSESCREEVLQFTSRANELDLSEYILPVIWQKPSGWETSTDPVVVALKRVQSEDIQNALESGRDSAEYRKRITDLARQLEVRVADVDERRSVATRTESDDHVSGEDQPGLDDTFEKLEASLDALPTIVARLEPATESLLAAWHSAGPSPEGSSARLFRSWIHRVTNASSEPTTELVALVEEGRSEIARMDEGITELLHTLRTTEALRREASTQELLDTLMGLPGQLNWDDSQWTETLDQLTALGSLSRRLRPAVNALTQTVTLMNDLAVLSERWAQSASELRTGA